MAFVMDARDCKESIKEVRAQTFRGSRLISNSQFSASLELKFFDLLKMGLDIGYQRWQEVDSSQETKQNLKGVILHSLSSAGWIAFD
jgi:hypothetical protein